MGVALRARPPLVSVANIGPAPLVKPLTDCGLLVADGAADLDVAGTDPALAPDRRGFRLHLQPRSQFGRCEGLVDLGTHTAALRYDPGMGDEMWDFGSNFWLGVGMAAAVATALATVIALAFSMWWRRVDRYTAEWAFFSGSSRWIDRASRDVTPPRADCTLGNVGAGTAYRVTVQGVGCHVVMSEPRRPAQQSLAGKAIASAVTSGEELDVRAYCEPTLWDKAEVVVLWREPRGWWPGMRRRIQREPLRDVAPRPVYECMQKDDSGQPFIGPTTSPEPAAPVLPSRLTPQHPTPMDSLVRRRAAWTRVKRSG